MPFNMFLRSCRIEVKTTSTLFLGLRRQEYQDIKESASSGFTRQQNQLKCVKNWK